MNKTTTTKFNKVFIKKMFKIIIPIILSQMIMVSVQFVDNFAIAKYDTAQNHLVAVGIGAEIWFAMSSVFSAVAIVFAILYAQFHASEDKSNFKSIFKINVHVGLMFAVLISLVMYFLAPQLVGLFYLNETAGGVDVSKGIAIDYLRVLAIGNIFISISYLLVNPLVIMGKTRYMLIIAVVSLFSNALLDYVFIYPLDMGAVGAAISTTLSYLITLLLAIFFFIKNIHYFKGVGNMFKINKKMFVFFLKRSWMILSVSTMMWSYASLTVLITSMYGTEMIKSMSIAYAIISIMFTVFPAINKVIKIVVSKELGKSNFEEAKKLSVYLFRVVMMFALVLGLLGVVLSLTLPRLLINEASDQSHAKWMILIMSLSIFGGVAQAYFCGVIEAGGNQMYPALLNYYSTLWLMIPLLIIGGPWVLGLNFEMTYLIAQTSTIIPGTIAYFIYRKNNWLVNLNKHKDLV